MMNDAALKVSAMRLLIEKLALLTQRGFLINKEPFDYTVWHRDLFKGMSVKDISRAAKEYCDVNNSWSYRKIL